MSRRRWRQCALARRGPCRLPLAYQGETARTGADPQRNCDGVYGIGVDGIANIRPAPGGSAISAVIASEGIGRAK
jgi:hypothetical protein